MPLIWIRIPIHPRGRWCTVFVNWISISKIIPLPSLLLCQNARETRKGNMELDISSSVFLFPLPLKLFSFISQSRPPLMSGDCCRYEETTTDRLLYTMWPHRHEHNLISFTWRREQTREKSCHAPSLYWFRSILSLIIQPSLLLFSVIIRLFLLIFLTLLFLLQ